MMGFGRRLVYLALMLLACLSSATISFSQVEQLGDVSCDLQAPVGYLDDFLAQQRYRLGVIRPTCDSFWEILMCRRIFQHAHTCL